MRTKEEIASLIEEVSRKLDQHEKGFLVDLIIIEDEEAELKSYKVKIEQEIEIKSLLDEFKTILSNASKREFAVNQKLKDDVTYDMRTRELITKKTKLRYLEIEIKKYSRQFRLLETLARLV
jgi:hypothetical protein